MPLLAYLVPHPPIIIPEVGRGQEAPAQATIFAMKDFGQAVAHSRPEVIVLLSPHGSAASLPVLRTGKEARADLSHFGVPGPGPSVALAQDLAQEIYYQAQEQGLPLQEDPSEAPLDHGAVVPLYFIRQAGYEDFELLSIATGASDLSGQKTLGNLIRKHLNHSGRSWALILSGDLSHRMKEDGPYGYHPDGPVFENAVAESIRSGRLDPMRALSPSTLRNAAPCAQAPLSLGWDILDDLVLSPRIDSHESPFGVGYMVAEVYKEEEL